MELHQLRYFVAVAETGGFVRAAQRCNVAQPSLSQQIIKLEQELGQPLFERVGRSVRLTAAGEALLPRARRILLEVQDARAQIVGEVEAGKGRLTVGVIPTVAPYLLPDAVRSFQQSYSEAHVTVLERLTERLIAGLVALEIDVCVLSLPIDNPQIATTVLCEEALVVALPHGHPLSTRAAVAVEELRGAPFIALDDEQCFGQQVSAFCYERQVSPAVVCRVTQLSTMLRGVTAGMGVALVPQTLAATEAGACVYRPIAEAAPSRTIVAAWHAGRRPSQLALHMIQHLREHLAQLCR
ncbi:MAG: hypothetical protein RLZZ387_5624 [Chloroflexota bacterium]